MGPHIVPQGWSEWPKNDNHKSSYYAEYGSYGPGASPKTRVSWSHQLTAKELERYSYEKVVKGSDNWDPYNNK